MAINLRDELERMYKDKFSTNRKYKKVTEITELNTINELENRRDQQQTR